MGSWREAAELAVLTSPAGVLPGSPTADGRSRETQDASSPALPQPPPLEEDKEGGWQPQHAPKTVPASEARLAETEDRLRAALRDHEGLVALTEEGDWQPQHAPEGLFPEGLVALTEELGRRLYLAEEARDRAESEAAESAALLRGVMDGLGARLGAAHALVKEERARREAVGREAAELQRLVEELGGSNEKAVEKIRALREERDALMARVAEQHGEGDESALCDGDDGETAVADLRLALSEQMARAAALEDALGRSAEALRGQRDEIDGLRGAVKEAEGAAGEARTRAEEAEEAARLAAQGLAQASNGLRPSWAIMHVEGGLINLFYNFLISPVRISTLCLKRPFVYR